jgi:hypothetical protein
MLCPDLPTCTVQGYGGGLDGGVIGYFTHLVATFIKCLVAKAQKSMIIENAVKAVQSVPLWTLNVELGL